MPILDKDAVTPYEATVFALEFMAFCKSNEARATENVLIALDASDEYFRAVRQRLDVMTVRGELRWH